MKRWGFETPTYQIKLNLNRSRKGKLSTTTPLFYIYCCSALINMKVAEAIIQNRMIHEHTEMTFHATYKGHDIHVTSSHGHGKQFIPINGLGSPFIGETFYPEKVSVLANES